MKVTIEIKHLRKKPIESIFFKARIASGTVGKEVAIEANKLRPENPLFLTYRTTEKI
jgi:hypothetical protein